jgi:hypothetical protein
MGTPEEQGRKLLCLCGKQLGTFTREGLAIKCRGCPETTIVPYGISTLAEAVRFVQRRRGEATRRRTGPQGVAKSRRPDVRKSGH